MTCPEDSYSPILPMGIYRYNLSEKELSDVYQKLSIVRSFQARNLCLYLRELTKKKIIMDVPKEFSKRVLPVLGVIATNWGKKSQCQQISK